MIDYVKLSEHTGLKQKVLKFFVKKQLIGEHLTEDNMNFLSAIKALWGNSEFIKLQFADYNTSARSRLVFGAGLNKIESYVLNRFIGHYADREEKFNLSVRQVVDETISYLQLPESMRQSVTDTSYEQRKRARNLVYRNENITLAAQALVTGKRQRLTKKIVSRNANNRRPSEIEVRKNIFGS